MYVGRSEKRVNDRGEKVKSRTGSHIGFEDGEGGDG